MITSQNPSGARGLGALFDFRPNNTSLSLQAGAVREADGFLGARAQGNFGEISADTAFAGIGGDWAAMQNWRLLASAYLGHTKADTGDGMLRAADDIVSSAFSLGLARAGLARRGDWLGLRLSQPLRAESGAAHLRIPAGPHQIPRSPPPPTQTGTHPERPQLAGGGGIPRPIRRRKLARRCRL